MFSATFDYAMDDRGRVPIPPLYRDAFRAGLVLSQGSPDRCLRLMTVEDYEAKAARVKSVSSFTRKGRRLRRVVAGRAMPVQLDAQNRVLVPAHLRAWAGLQRNVLLVGVIEGVEIWDPQAYATEMDAIDETLESTLESVEEWQR